MINTKYLIVGVLISLPQVAICQKVDTPVFLNLYVSLAGIILLIAISITLWLLKKTVQLSKYQPKNLAISKDKTEYINDLSESQIEFLLNLRSKARETMRTYNLKKGSSVLIALLSPGLLYASSGTNPEISIWMRPGIIITLILLAIPLLFAVFYLIVKSSRLISKVATIETSEEASMLADYLYQLEGDEIDATLIKRKSINAYRPESLIQENFQNINDTKGILNSVNQENTLAFIKKKIAQKIPNAPAIPNGSLILWYLASAIFWLVFGTTVGEYLGIKFVAPEIDTVSWLSFGRLRPVHTNAVFWGWSSLAMLGLAHYVVPTVSNCSLSSSTKGWISLILINLSVILGTLCLMAGINNGGGEYREYVWPVMGLFGLGLVVALINLVQTVAQRKTNEIYISNWYIISSIIFTLTISFIAYWPTWQDGLGETIIQGYYMHQGVGMWFMLFTLGLVYYYLPQQVNKPIYSYGLGILAFWSQILFYTLIGTHHFVFSSIPWWLQTVAIVGSAGMIIPVIAGTTNFAMTFKGSWSKLSNSYTLPFFFVGILFYFTGSLQGTAEAFRFTNQLWHFTDFTVAHSHLTMYGIIAFLLWGSIYVTVPRITGKEPSQILTGIHFWMAFIGLLFYTIPLMIGGTLKGLHWMNQGPFIESVTLMAPYWLWRAIGGTIMWISHVVFAYNFYLMIRKSETPNVAELALKILQGKVEKEQLK